MEEKVFTIEQDPTIASGWKAGAKSMHTLHLLSLRDEGLCFCSVKILGCRVLARTFLDINGLIESLNPKAI